MRRASAPSALLRRTALLLAAALHLLGAAAGPVVHAWAFRASPAESSVHAAGQPDAPRAVHDELSCAVCRSLGTVALPAPADEVRTAADPRTAPAPAEARLQGTAPAARLHARAPPAFS